MKARIFLTVLLISLITCTVPTFASETPVSNVPYLTDITFENAEIDGGFNLKTTVFNITLDDNSKSPSVASFQTDGEANVLINYIYDVSYHQTGITVTLQFDNGTIIYTFNYSNVETYTVSNNADLIDLNCEYAEIQPSLNSKTTKYKMYIPSDLTELNITPITDDINAYCASQNLILAEGQETTLNFTVTASNGDTKAYEFDIKRVDKTLDEVKEEMKDEDFTSFVNIQKIYEEPEFYVAIIVVAAGILIILILLFLTRHTRVTVIDKDEPEFYLSPHEKE